MWFHAPSGNVYMHADSQRYARRVLADVDGNGRPLLPANVSARLRSEIINGKYVDGKLLREVTKAYTDLIDKLRAGTVSVSDAAFYDLDNLVGMLNTEHADEVQHHFYIWR